MSTSYNNCTKSHNVINFRIFYNFSFENVLSSVIYLFSMSNTVCFSFVRLNINSYDGKTYWYLIRNIGCLKDNGIATHCIKMGCREMCDCLCCPSHNDQTHSLNVVKNVQFSQVHQSSDIPISLTFTFWRCHFKYLIKCCPFSEVQR